MVRACRRLLLSNAGAQLLHDLARGAAGCLILRRIEGNSANAGVAAPAIALANLCQVHRRLALRPRVGTNRYFHPERTLAQPDTVDRVRMQIVRDELVVALELAITNVEVDRSVSFFGALS